MNFTLTATKREQKGEKTRNAGTLPGVVYGTKADPMSLSFDYREFAKVFKQAGESTLVDLMLDGKNEGKVIIQDVQYDPVKDFVIHVDLKRIDMNKIMTAPVELKFTGEAPVIKEQGGTLVTTVHTVTVKCLPKDLVSHIDVDLTPLKNYEVVIKIKDIKLPEGITISSPHAEDLVIKAARALTEEEIKAMEEKNAELDVSKIESAKPEKVAEGIEGAEGAAAKAGAAPAAGAAAAKAPEAKKEEKK